MPSSQARAGCLAGPVAAAGYERRGEHLGRDVERLVGAQTLVPHESEHGADVALVELTERLRLLRGERKQLVIGQLREIRHHLLSSTGRLVVTCGQAAERLRRGPRHSQQHGAVHALDGVAG